MRIDKENTVLVIIDVQDRLFPHMFDSKKLRNSLLTLLKGVAILDQIPVVVTEQYPKGLGNTLPEIMDLIPDVQTIEKTAFSCVDEPAFISELETYGREEILLAGIESHVCVLQTALDLLGRGFRPTIVWDAVTSRKSEDKEIAKLRLNAEGCRLTTVESLLLELCRYSGTTVFKQISTLIK